VLQDIKVVVFTCLQLQIPSETKCWQETNSEQGRERWKNFEKRVKQSQIAYKKGDFRRCNVKFALWLSFHHLVIFLSRILCMLSELNRQLLLNLDTTPTTGDSWDRMIWILVSSLSIVAESFRRDAFISEWVWTHIEFFADLDLRIFLPNECVDWQETDAFSGVSDANHHCLSIQSEGHDHHTGSLRYSSFFKISLFFHAYKQQEVYEIVKRETLVVSHVL
jgi:hypothetical protein